MKGEALLQRVLPMAGALFCMPMEASRAEEFISSGSARVDRIIEVEAEVLRRIIDIDPLVIFFQEKEGVHARASYEESIPGKPSGRIYIGRNLVQSLNSNGEYGIARIVWVLAHEFFHIYQFKENLHRKLPGKYLELQADYMGAWFLSYRTKALGFSEDDTIFSWWVTYRGMREIADGLYNSLHHHGNWLERTFVFDAGFEDDSPRFQTAVRRSLPAIRENASEPPKWHFDVLGTERWTLGVACAGTPDSPELIAGESRHPPADAVKAKGDFFSTVSSESLGALLADLLSADECEAPWQVAGLDMESFERKREYSKGWRLTRYCTGATADEFRGVDMEVSHSDRYYEKLGHTRPSYSSVMVAWERERGEETANFRKVFEDLIAIFEFFGPGRAEQHEDCTEWKFGDEESVSLEIWKCPRGLSFEVEIATGAGSPLLDNTINQLYELAQ